MNKYSKDQTTNKDLGKDKANLGNKAGFGQKPSSVPPTGGSLNKDRTMGGGIGGQSHQTPRKWEDNKDKR